MSETDQDLERLIKLGNRLRRSVHATLDYEALLMENKQNSFYDRLKRGMTPWGAQTSRYPPEEETDDVW